MVAVQVLAEGGPGESMADSKSFLIRIRQELTATLSAAAPGLALSVEPCGSRWRARERFAAELANSGWDHASLEDHSAAMGPYPLLLVDSERAVASGTAHAWAHLAGGKDRWVRPTGADDEQAALMVQVMEAWFLVDRATTQSYFGPGYDPARLPPRQASSISKGTIKQQFAAATRRSERGTYDKQAHSPDLLALVDLAGGVAPTCAWAQRLVNHLQLLAATP